MAVRSDGTPSHGWGGRRPGSGNRKAAGAPRALSVPRGPAAPMMRSAAPRFDPGAMRHFIEASKTGARGSVLPPMRRVDSYAELYRPYEHPAMPPKAQRMAMDSGLTNWTNAQFAGTVFNAAAYEGLVFPGYAYLSELALRTEFRVISETIADDATRKWIDFEVTGDEVENKRRAQNDPKGEAERMADPDERKKRVIAAGKMEKVKALGDDQARLGVRDAIYCVLRDDGFFGRAHLFLGIGNEFDGSNQEELAMPIGDGRDDMSRAKVSQGAFKSIKPIEAVWTYPMAYNAMNPLLPNWYDPQRWYVQGTEVHKSRMPVFVSHPVPDLLKPAYSFGGLSNSQLCQPYVDIWLQTRQSVAAIIKAFSVFVLKSNMSTMLQAGAATDLMTRVMMFNAFRDNQGCMVIDKDTEDFMNVSAQLSGLHELQAQALEHIASASRIPLVKLTGIEPSGLNASSEGSLQCYDDTIAAYQNRVVRPNLTRIVNFEQLSLFGEIDPEITIVFEKLREATPKERSDLQKADAERDDKYISMGSLAPEEVRKRIIDDPELPYAGLDPDDVPDLETEEEAGLTFGKKPGEEGEGGKPGETGGGAP